MEVEAVKDLIVTPRCSFSWEVEELLWMDRDKDGNSMTIAVRTKENPLTARVHEGVISKRLNETKFSWPAAPPSEKEKQPTTEPDQQAAVQPPQEAAGKVLPFKESESA